MIDRDSPVTDEELHAFVDDELPADRKEAIAAWLAKVSSNRSSCGV